MSKAKGIWQPSSLHYTNQLHLKGQAKSHGNGNVCIDSCIMATILLANCRLAKEPSHPQLVLPI